MMQARRAEERGQTQIDWLDSRHSFSFGRYIDRNNMGFRSLRVINEDFIAPGKGFGAHPHNDMEILTYVLRGELEHRDSTGGGSVLRHGDIQLMRAGSGIVHSEFNHSPEQELHLLQIWIQPEKRGLTPGYQERHFDVAMPSDQLKVIASPTGEGAALMIHQQVRIHAGRLKNGAQQSFSLGRAAGLWVQLVSGELSVNGEVLAPGDALEIEDEALVTIEAREESELLVFEFENECVDH